MPSLKNNINAVTNAVGATQVGLVWGLSNVRWESEEDRDNFLNAIIKQKDGS
tara:strand:+ start:277 stop:432 length:156 start_codon:yes stop_codon:yes gene_type:complete